MSFVRGGRPQQTKAKRPVRIKKTAASKREWVSTVSDLSVHKLTPAQLSHRHEIHKSHNKAVAQWELREKALKHRLRHHGSPGPLDQASLSIMKEVFSDQLLLQDVLDRSDRAMAVVKDLFGEAPRRQTGHPSVTIAPNGDPRYAMRVLQRPDPSSQPSSLSQSIVDQQALNEVEASVEDYSDEDASPACSSDYYVIRRGNQRKIKARSCSRLIQQRNRSNSEHLDNHHRTSDNLPDQSALNATMAVQHVRSKQSMSEEGEVEPSVVISQVLDPELSLNRSGKIRNRTSRTRKSVSQRSALDGSSFASLSDQSSLGLLQAMLGQVEADLDTLSSETEPASVQSQKSDRDQGLTGFSVALVSTLGRLVHLIKRREVESHTEAQEKRRLEEELREQRGLIDALTAETMTLREEAAARQAGLQQQTAELEQKLEMVVLVMGGLGLLEANDDQHQESEVKASVSHSVPVAERDPEQLRASIIPAVLISPPRQCNNRQSPVTHAVELHQENLPVDIPPSYRGIQAHSSASSLTSLPLTSLPSNLSLSQTSDSLSSNLSPEAILAEIALLSRQNNLIKTQLSHSKGLRSGVVGSPNSTNEQWSLSSSSKGRVTPPSAEERRISVSTYRERSPHVPAADGEQPINQIPSPKTLSVKTVEERLLELNRQSAAARGRVLELIEQQKQRLSATESPCVSPIPPSAVSPLPAGGGGGGPEVPMLLPEPELPSQTVVDEKRNAGSELSSHSVGGITGDGKTQIQKRREREGWFALSAHVR